MKQEAIQKQRVRRRTGDEAFIGMDSNLLEYWEWAHSDIMSNTERGRLAEFIVMKAIGSKKNYRVEWDTVDVTTPDNIKVEVKTSAYLQTWKQFKLSAIQFDIAPKKEWFDGINQYSEKPRHHSDAYVFCLFACTDGLKANPMDLTQWEFYVLSTRVLDERVPRQKTITLSSLIRLGAKKVDFEGLKEAVHSAYSYGKSE